MSEVQEMKWYERIAKNRKPYLKVENDGVVYLERWSLIPRNWYFNIYLHRFTNSDLAVHHDHPWHSVAIIMKGGFIEHRPNKEPRRCRAGGIYFRSPSSLHWLELPGEVTWTLFITGPFMKRWGFVENGEWIHNKTFLATREGRRKRT